MNYLTKALLLIYIGLAGCASIDLGYISLFRESFKNNKIEDLSSFNNTQYSFIKASRGRNDAIFILAKYDDGIETWIGSRNERIITFHGLILETYGLGYDFKIHNLDLAKEFIGNGRELSSYISLSNPNARYMQAKYELLQSNKKTKDCDNLNEYSLQINSIGYSTIITVCRDIYGNITSSAQQNHPFDKRIFLQFYYKY